jgi:uncharacterized protein with gpF-like domain
MSSLEYTTQTLDEIDNNLMSAYKKALDRIRALVLQYDEKGHLTISEIVKYNRMAILEDQINEILQEAGNQTQKLIETSREDVFNKAYDDIFKSNEIGLVNLPNKAIFASIENPLYNANFANAMKSLTDEGLKKISSVITQGIIQGKSVTNIAKDIKLEVNMSAKRAITIARTETLRAMSQGQIKSEEILKDKGFKIKKIWEYSYPIKYSRQDHIDMDGQEANEDGWFEFPDGVRMQAPRTSGDPSHDINCRCSILVEILED